jgi:hypothetical protein
MRTLGRFVIGTLAAFCLVWLSVFVYSLLVAHLPIPRHWWKAYAVIIYGTEIVAFVPFVVVIALLSCKLFPRYAVASSLICTLAAVIALFVPRAVDSYDLLLSSLRINAEFILLFVVGVPLVVSTLLRWRANRSIQSGRAASRRG